MRIKYYLRGIGCGIIFSVIIMSVAMGSKGKNEVSDAEIIQRAKQLGMVEADSTEKKENKVEPETETQTPSDMKTETTEIIEDHTQDSTKKSPVKDQVSTNKDKNQNGDEEQEKGSVNSLVGQKDTVSSADQTEKQDKTQNNTAQKDTEKKTDTKKDETATTEYVSFTVKRGQVCRQIAENLQKQGIVDDADAFREYMAGKGLASNIRCGTFNLPKGATYEKIADYLTKK